MLLALLLAAASSPAKPIDLASWFSPDDYPLEARKAGAEGNVGFQVDVDSTGKPIACRIAKSSGSQLLDQATCRIVLAKGHFTPASSHGKAVPSVFSTSAVWRLQVVAPPNGYFAVVLDYSKGSEQPTCSIMQKGVIAAPTCEVALSHLASMGAGGKMTKLVLLVSATFDGSQAYQGEADWGQRLSFMAVDLYVTKDGKRACTLVASEGSNSDANPCAAFAAASSLTEEEKRSALKQRLERSLFGIFSRSPNQGVCKSGESAAELRSCK